MVGVTRREILKYGATIAANATLYNLCRLSIKGIIIRDVPMDRTNKKMGIEAGKIAEDAHPIDLSKGKSYQEGSSALANGKYCMINLITWNKNNGLSLINWDAITELSVFHVRANSDGTIAYHGDAVNFPEVIETAHSHNVNVTLAVGGAGLPASTIRLILGSSRLSQALIGNILKEVKDKGYNGVQMDFENDNPADFDEKQHNKFIQNLSKALKAADPKNILTMTFSNWETSINPVACEPYVDKLLLMFNPSEAILSNYSKRLKDPVKLCVGYEFGKETPEGLLSKLRRDVRTGHGIFFWHAGTANSAFYKVMIDAFS